MINRLLPWWSSNSTPKLPSFYTQYRSQEDIIKAMAIKMARQEEWMALALAKINELTDEVNKLS